MATPMASTIALVALVLLASFTSSTSSVLPTILRAAQPGDIVGSFSLKQPPSTSTCPSTIEHRSYNQSNNPNVYTVPHGEISQEAVNCDQYSYLTMIKDEAVLNQGLIGDEEAAARDNVRKYIRNNSVIVNAANKLKDEGVAFWGLLEFQTRICGNLTKFRTGTAGMIIKESDKDVEIEGVGNLEGGSTYMILVDDATDRVCVYDGTELKDEDVPAPVNSASPSPSATRDPNAVGASPGADDSGSGVAGAVGEDGEEVTGSPDGDDDDDSDDDDDDDEGAECFPGESTVELEDGSVKRMSELVLGDRVRVGPKTFSDVFMFTHKIKTGNFDFVRIATMSGNSLHLSSGHYLYVNGHLTAAKSVKMGDSLRLADGSATRVSQISSASRQGLFNPQTLHGDIIVDNIAASTFTMAVQPSVANMLLSPMRALYSLFGVTSSVFENGGGMLTQLMPAGAPIECATR